MPLTGKYFQQHAPVREQSVPVGHSVRFAYLETAIAMLARETGDNSYLPALERCWDHMVSRRMYVTGGIGSLPALEGFGRDYELDPEIAYAETCAALGQHVLELGDGPFDREGPVQRSVRVAVV